MAVALSKKRNYGIVAMLTSQKPLLDEMRKLNIELVTKSVEAQLASLKLQPSLLDQIKKAQVNDLGSGMISPWIS